ncbi:Benzoyl-CoA reductase/2-hydroxyglutaryl-CoA dehydratase subunit, BcrC/BadD/HgdB [Tindallia magadiensis]|uniref:Benzoyl-CoA reductase/2-hydroxyglutaryl-CoA dehydratase subunit, BcrC/BadD/HgdB n=1 Tax=Tindallia magadiensis TaxID=69895 RepID=A0A1I3EQW8_9FIRM|nr:double-cubane-cluster-containing anaerobic reductase [Tindallia magadiensis]SFI01359.1 Benzoyl-CoA reductase/2-hydroxyglutaryl-CoA dehydratase subunit, BcrC/BadD/HgdB [Tindallia magadiensis]
MERPQIMEKIEDLRGINSVKVKEASEAGQKIVGMYCVFSPQEIAMAAGAIPVSLCGTSNDPIEAAEQELPRNLCPLIKSSYGFAITDKCPFFYFADTLLAETTCDGKKKMYELMGKIKPMHLMNLPQSADGEENLELWKKEMIRFKEHLEDQFKVEITNDSLREAIKLANREREVMKKVHQINARKPAPMTGMDMMKAQWIKGFNIEKEEGIRLMEALLEEVESNLSKLTDGEEGPRILLTGVPVGIGSEKVIQIIEESGGKVVALENCTGYKGLDVMVDETKDPIEALAEKYLSTPCSCMYNNQGRLDLIKRMAEEYQVDGVLDLTWQACHTYNIESYFVREFVKEELNLPFLQIETDYSQSDTGQLKLRIEAFLETAEKN